MNLKKIFFLIIKIVKKILRWFSSLLKFLKDLIFYKKLSNEKISFFDFNIQLADRTKNTAFDPHYFYQGAWAFEKIIVNKPNEHTDIGSDIRWASLVSVVTPVVFIDIRPFKTKLDSFRVIEGDILNLPFNNSSIKSLSCLHVAEHIGLGRYGDKLNPNGTKFACQELSRVLALEGHLYFSVPVGMEKTCFNAHRIFNPKTIIEYFNQLELKELSGITDKGQFIRNINIELLVSSKYACGLFEFKKIK